MSSRALYVVLVAGLAAIGVWLWRVSTSTTELPPEPPPEITDMPLPTPPEEIAPEPVNVVAPTAPPPVAPDPQLDVHTAVADMADLLRAGDFANFVARYMPPEVRAMMVQAGPEALQQMAQSMAQANVPGTRENQQMQQMLQALDSMKTIGPTLNDAGDQATYPVNIPGGPRSLRLIKVDGRWYFGEN